jgi:hypothetical protein
MFWHQGAILRVPIRIEIGTLNERSFMIFYCILIGEFYWLTEGMYENAQHNNIDN